MIDPLYSEATGSPQSEMNELIAQNQSWLSALAQASDRSQDPDKSVVGHFGAKNGFFVVRSNGGFAYVKDAHFHMASEGRLLDEHNRSVLGFSANEGSVEPAPLSVPQNEIAAHHFASYDIDERGVLFGILPKTDQVTQPDRVELLGRLCVAIFPAAQELGQRGSSDFVATGQSGSPRLFPADAVHLSIERQPASLAFQQVRDNRARCGVAAREPNSMLRLPIVRTRLCGSL